MDGNNKNVCEVCGSNGDRCGRCGNMCGWGRNSLLRWILGIIIITWVFCIGMKFGEMKIFLQQAGYGRTPSNVMFRATNMGANAIWSTEAAPASFSVSTAGVPLKNVQSGTVKVVELE